MHIHELETPVAIVDLDKLERNIARFQEYTNQHDIANRPHIKTHKIPAIAQMQIAAGAVGITCQKLGEAEVMANAGIRDIFLPYNILGAAKLERLTQLAHRCTLSVTADSAVTVQGLAEAMRPASLRLPVLVEFDSGAKRCGVQTPEEAAKLARLIASSEGLRFGGLMTYPSSARAAEFAQAATALLQRQGIATERVSGGGTAQMWQAHTFQGISEHRAGMYIFGDRSTINAGALALEECAFTVHVTVVSRPTAERGIIDGGSKTFSSDLLGQDGYGLILEYPDARITGLSEEHGTIDFTACAQRPTIGERLTVVANHCCPVVNLFNELVGVRQGMVEVRWPVVARGMVQ